MKSGWVSRSDDSGTHKREVRLWQAAGLDPDAQWDGLLRTGSGMGLSLQVAGEKRAYILSDIGTFLAFEKRIDLVALSKSADSLRNIYSLLQLDPAKFSHSIKTEEAEALEAYLLSAPTLERIAEFGQSKYGRALFTPVTIAEIAGSGTR